MSARKSILATMDTKLFIGQVTQNRFLLKKKSFFDINKSPWNNLTLNNEKNKEAYNLIMKLISARVEY